jgi:hypothetical protein
VKISFGPGQRMVFALHENDQIRVRQFAATWGKKIGYKKKVVLNILVSHVKSLK